MLLLALAATKLLLLANRTKWAPGLFVRVIITLTTKDFAVFTESCYLLVPKNQ